MRTLLKLKFLGGVASENLTGSCTLLTIEQGKKQTNILLDAGLIQCNFAESFEKNSDILNRLQPEKIDYIVVTHSHVDHVGRIPLLVKNGFKGRIICTEATCDLLGFMLEDSAKIQTKEANYLNTQACYENDHTKKLKSRDRLTLGNYDRKRSKSKKTNHHKPLYTTKDVELVYELIKNHGFEYHQWFKLDHNISFKFYQSGHVMGGAVVVIKIVTDEGEKHICFSGDLGRKDGIILPPPEPVDEMIDYLILESTYGGKNHPARSQEIKRILRVIRKAHKNKQKIIIPSFALERSQEIIYLLSYYMNKGMIPTIPIYLDSPLASKITTVFSKNWERGMFSDQEKLSFNPFDPAENKFFRIVCEQKESEILVGQNESQIVIAGSGMCDAGRVRDHLRHNLGSKNTVVCLVGYMAKNSLGQRLKDKFAVIKMNKQIINVQAEIVNFDSFSAHADGPFLVEYTKSIFAKKQSAKKQVFLVHSERQSAEALKIALENELPEVKDNKIKITIPDLYQEQFLF